MDSNEREQRKDRIEQWLRRVNEQANGNRVKGALQLRGIPRMSKALSTSKRYKEGIGKSTPANEAKIQKDNRRSGTKDMRNNPAISTMGLEAKQMRLVYPSYYPPTPSLKRQISTKIQRKNVAKVGNRTDIREKRNRKIMRAYENDQRIRRTITQVAEIADPAAKDTCHRDSVAEESGWLVSLAAKASWACVSRTPFHSAPWESATQNPDYCPAPNPAAPARASLRAHVPTRAGAIGGLCCAVRRR